MAAEIEIDKDRLPRHVAIIMDGNGRWATQRGLTRITGHRRGKQSVSEVVEAARRLGIEYLSLYAFSSENWQRPRDEVAALMRFLRHYLAAEMKKMMKNGIRLLAIGNLKRLPREVQEDLRRTIDDTRQNTGMTVILAVSYGGREEITEAVRAIARRVRKEDLDPADVDEDLVAAHLGTAGVPDPDLLIRTSGEMRISNFLLWQIAYTEIFVTDTLWPDFREREFHDAIAHFQRRERRFGRTGEQAERERLRAAH
jgi:undecaprenyl diphosphate synthase